MANTEQLFQAAIGNAGLPPPDTIEADGALHRFSSNGKRGDDSGWYVLHLDGVPGGSFGCWRSDLSMTWSEKPDTDMTQAEREAQRQRIQQAQKQRDADKEAAQATAATEAARRWDAAAHVTAHDYLTTKGVAAHGLRVDAAGGLLVPMRDAVGKLRSLQTIDPEGGKRFLIGGKVKGCYHSVGKPNGALIVCEGYATGASIHEATGHAVAVTFNAGNLEAVAVALRGKYPELKMTIAADDDYQTEGNPGMVKATQAAKSAGALLAVPDFGADRPDKATDFNDLHQISGAAVVKRCIDGEAHSVSNDPRPEPGDWPELVPLVAQYDREPYPIDALPDSVRLAVLEVAGFVKAPTPLIVTSALAALSLAIQAHVDVERAENLTGPTGLFLLAIGDSGERKTTCDGFFTKAIRDYEAQAQEAAKPEITAFKSDFEAWEAQRAGIKEHIKTEAKKGASCDALTQDLRNLNEDEPKPPRVPSLMYGDATPEALAYSLATEWPSGGVVSSEAGTVFGSHGMGGDSVMRNLSTLNQLWDGATLKTKRRTSESFTVRGARLTMALQVQESTLRAFFDSTKGLARGSGFLARFLLSWPESTIGFRPFTEAPSWPHLGDFNRRLTAILNQPVPMDDDGVLSPIMLTLSPDAKAAWINFHDVIEAQLSIGKEMHDVRDVASKTADNAVRLAALFHNFAGKVGAIDADSMDSGARIALWHLLEARRFLGGLALPAELANPARLESWMLDYCERENTDTVSTKQIQQFGPSGLRDKATIDAAVNELIELGRARMVKVGKRKMVQINPALLDEVPK